LWAGYSEIHLSKKRKSRGRSKGGKGSSGFVQCSQCGRPVPRDKAKKVTQRVTLVEPTLARELRGTGAYVPSSTVQKYYCISCAVHFGVVKVRARAERRFR
jgi:small subunit ribosomal protein S26e